MLRIVLRVCGGLLLLSLLVYLVDFAVWHVRLAHGSGTDTVEVSRVSIAALKAGKEEYYFEGMDTQPCTRSLLPPPTASGWGVPCWWLVRHRQMVVRY
ncbi:MAG: hypothetical protein ACRYGF_17475 [Janthinobacterium lividum]